MTSQSRKHRGYATQALLAADLRDSGVFPYATDAGAGRQGKDILNTPGAAIEVKARAGFNPAADMRQAAANAADGETPIIVCRLNGQGPANIDAWVAFTTWGAMKEFLAWKAAKAANGPVFCQGCGQDIFSIACRCALDTNERPGRQQ